MRSQVRAAANTIASQASRLGYLVETETAGTGTVYLTCSHEDVSGDILIRVADHECNEARYAFRVNREPDHDCEPGYQAVVVRRLAEAAGVDPESVGYLRGAAKRAAKIESAKLAAKERRDAEIAQWQKQREDYQRRFALALPRASDIDQTAIAEYAASTGKRRKHIKRSGRYVRAIAAVEAIM